MAHKEAPIVVVLKANQALHMYLMNRILHHLTKDSVECQQKEPVGEEYRILPLVLTSCSPSLKVFSPV